MADRRTSEFDQRQWARDIERHDRMKRIFTLATTDAVRALAADAMRKIEERYPQHFKRFA